jgi:hypothetical protein
MNVKNKVIDSAKMVFLLCSCEKAIQLFMKKLSEHHGASSIYHTFPFIKLQSNGNLFEMTNFMFKDSYNGGLVKLCQLDCKDTYLDNAVSSFLKKAPLINNDTSMVSNISYLISHIKLFINNKASCFFIPLTVNYGKTSSVNHQCALIINKNTKGILFYEPYGTYVKYNSDYSACMKQLCDVLVGVLNMEKSKSWVYDTFHNHINQNTETGGIQTILCNYNNKLYNHWSKLMLEIFPNWEIVKHMYLDDLDKKDLNHYILNVLDKLYKKRDHDNIIKALYIYGMSNSKTCVSITIMEIDWYLKYECNSDKSKGSLNDHFMILYSKFNEASKQKIDELESGISDAFPNMIILDFVYDFIKKCKKPDCIYKTLRENTVNNDICEKLNLCINYGNKNKK